MSDSHYRRDHFPYALADKNPYRENTKELDFIYVWPRPLCLLLECTRDSSLEFGGAHYLQEVGSWPVGLHCPLGWRTGCLERLMVTNIGQFVLRPCMPICLVCLASQVTVQGHVPNVWLFRLGTVPCSLMECCGLERVGFTRTNWEYAFDLLGVVCENVYNWSVRPRTVTQTLEIV